jgi:hypothetical protein
VKDLEKKLAETQVELTKSQLFDTTNVLFIENPSRSTCELLAENEKLTKLCVSFQTKINELEEKIEKFTKLQWSLEMRESVRRLVRYLKHVRKTGTIDEFLEKCKHGENSVTLTAKDIEDLIEYQEDLQDYLSSHAHQDFNLQIINKIPKGITFELMQNFNICKLI